MRAERVPLKGSIRIIIRDLLGYYKIRALIIRIGFGSKLCYNCNKEPPQNPILIVEASTLCTDACLPTSSVLRRLLAADVSVAITIPVSLMKALTTAGPLSYATCLAEEHTWNRTVYLTEVRSRSRILSAQRGCKVM